MSDLRWRMCSLSENSRVDACLTSRHSRVVIIGAGAVGSHLATSLRGGFPLLVVDSSEQVRAAFVARGIAAIAPLDAAASPLDSRAGLFRNGDVVLLATSAAVAVSAALRVPMWVPIVCIANGLTPELSAMRNRSIAYGVVEFAVSSSGPGRAVRTRDGCLILQRRSAGDVTSWLAAALDPRLQPVRLTDDIDAYRHAKLMLNASLDPVAAIIGGLIGDVFRRRDSFRAFRVLLDEALHVARAAGWRLGAIQGFRPDSLSRIFATPCLRAIAAYAASRQARTVSSTLAREIGRGELGEAEHLCGAITTEGARVGVPTPAHERAMELLRQISNAPGGQGGRPDLARQLIQSRKDPGLTASR